jgi:tRNA threonylcarbamoyladenosine biosynthesis protein TsaE
VHALTQAAFKDQGRLAPPSGALRETESSVREDLAVHGGLIAFLDGRPAGCLRFRFDGGRAFVRRVAVDPALQRRGFGRDLMAAAEEELRKRGQRAVYLRVRKALPGNLAFYERLGYRPVEDGGYWLQLGKKL